MGLHKLHYAWNENLLAPSSTNKNKTASLLTEGMKIWLMKDL